jgi:tRNA threonylcarbamoyladenosine biosynthesis protein TsaE
MQPGAANSEVSVRRRLRQTAPVLLQLPDLAATDAFAARVAGAARPGDAILLDGPLGAGKTAFVRAFLRAAAGDPALEVPSPSFTLVQTYETPRFRAHHFDLWRLDGPGALAELGWDDARADVVLVEWPDRLGALRPEAALSIGLAHGTGEARTATLAGWPDRIGALA